jgi:hypothetical protein
MLEPEDGEDASPDAARSFAYVSEALARAAGDRLPI